MRLTRSSSLSVLDGKHYWPTIDKIPFVVIIHFTKKGGTPCGAYMAHGTMYKLNGHTRPLPQLHDSNGVMERNLNDAKFFNSLRRKAHKHSGLLSVQSEVHHYPDKASV